MRRRAVAPRPDWLETAKRLGFSYASAEGVPYWDESAQFEFSLLEIENEIEEPTRELHAMCLDLANRAAVDARMLDRLGVPERAHDYVAASWANRAGEPALYGRFDLAYDGSGRAKLLEYNADTPTSLFEAAVFQWVWLEERLRRGELPPDADQFNSLHERLIERFATFSSRSIFHFAAMLDDVEDGGTVAYLADCAKQAGHRVSLIDVERVGVDAVGRFTDEHDRVIDQLFKLHPWEWIFDSDYANRLAGSACRFVEPAWKAMLSTKAILPLLWEAHSGHPNLLPAYFEDDPRAAGLDAFVRKPILSRQGSNVSLRTSEGEETVEGPYGAEGFVIQQAARLFRSQAGHAVLGSWIVGDEACGLGMREDVSAITTDASRFIPHVILG